MRTFYPDFAPDFRCRAGQCAHSCCKGWEIDVDEDTLSLYDSVPGPFGDALRAGIHRDSDGAHFCLTQEERCPFLRSDGLCEIILRLGEDALCDICALHPRFYGELGELCLEGLGLSCEAVCALLLERSEPLRFVEEGGGAVLEFPALAALTGLELPEGAFSFEPTLTPDYYEALLRLFSETEPIDRRWTEELAALQKALPVALEKAGQLARRCDYGRYDRILQVLLYRQLENAPAWGASVLLAYGKVCADFVFLTHAWTGDGAEALRRFSEQIEYSTENVEIIRKGALQCFDP